MRNKTGPQGKGGTETRKKMTWSRTGQRVPSKSCESSTSADICGTCQKETILGRGGLKGARLGRGRSVRSRKNSIEMKKRPEKNERGTIKNWRFHPRGGWGTQPHSKIKEKNFLAPSKTEGGKDIKREQVG